MLRWLSSVLAAAIGIHFAFAAEITKAWVARPKEAVAALLDTTSVLLASTSAYRRDRLASIERVADFPVEHPLRRTGAAIGMLSIQFEHADGKRKHFYCTAALIRPELVLTNRHCIIRPPATLVALSLWLDHTTDGTATVVALDLVALESDTSLDYALVRLRAPAPGSLRTSLSNNSIRLATPGERLFMIHHSDGDPQQVSRGFCRAELEQTRPDKELVHSCPTRSGSSGALVFAERDGALVGLHHSISTRPDAVRGFATPMTTILGKSQALLAQTTSR
jgi:Trypsin-like peptidase domain